MMLRHSIQKLIQRQDLTFMDCEQSFQEIVAEDANRLQSAAFLTLLRAKSETADELHAIVKVIKQSVVPVSVSFPVLDIVGTGGDGSGSVNISTGSAILAASCGIKIVKHGNRAISSLAGSADVLEAFGIPIEISAQQASATVNAVGICFCIAPSGLRQLKSLRKELNVSTALNFLGPVLNPANPAHLLMGVFDSYCMPVIAQLLQKLGTVKSMIVHGSGLDELSTVGATKVVEVTQEKIIEYEITPEQFGLRRCALHELRGGDAAYNAALLMEVFSGTQNAIADTLILNAAAALYLYGVYPSITKAIPHARENLQNGKALQLLNQWRTLSHE